MNCIQRGPPVVQGWQKYIQTHTSMLAQVVSEKFWELIQFSRRASLSNVIFGILCIFLYIESIEVWNIDMHSK